MADCKANVRQKPNLNFVNARSGPGTNHEVVRQVRLGESGLLVLEVKPDENRTMSGSKVYQWFHLQFPAGGTGWIRDDLLNIVGDCGDFGYATLTRDTSAFALERGSISDEALAERERVRKAAFNITAAFEGGGYGSYQNFDRGIVSYGRFQFTLAAGSLATVLSRYLAASTSPAAEQLRQRFHQRVNARDGSLRQDMELRTLLLQAANEEAMQIVQDAVATELYWERALNLSAVPRGIQTPLGLMFVFDTAINHGIFHNMFSEAEASFDVPFKSRVDENGVGEEAFITRVAAIRSERLTRLANARRLFGLIPRGEFWVRKTTRNRWRMRGRSSDGTMLVKTGVRVQVRNP